MVSEGAGSSGWAGASAPAVLSNASLNRAFGVPAAGATQILSAVWSTGAISR
jgi:hypothetical protein